MSGKKKTLVEEVPTSPIDFVPSDVSGQDTSSFSSHDCIDNNQSIPEHTGKVNEKQSNSSFKKKRKWEGCISSKAMVVVGEVSTVNMVGMDTENIGQKSIRWTDMFGIRRIGLYMSAFTIGFIFMSGGAFILPVFQYLLQSPSETINALNTFPLMFYSVSFVFALIVDAVPIRGYRQKYYIFGGMFGCFLVTVGQAIFVLLSPTVDRCYLEPGKPIPYSDPLCSGQKMFRIPQFSAFTFASFLLLQNFFFQISNVASTGLVCCYALKESEKHRGELQSYYFAFRTLGHLVAFMSAGLALNGPPFGGTFSTYIPLWGVILMLAAIQLVTLPFLWILEEEKISEQEQRQSFRKTAVDSLKQIWKLLDIKIYCRILLGNLMLGYASIMPKALGSLSYSSQLHITEIVSSFSNITDSLIGIVVLCLMGKYFVNVNWRGIIYVTKILIITIPLLSLPIVFGPLNNPTYWLFMVGFDCLANYSTSTYSSWMINEVCLPNTATSAMAFASNIRNASGNLSSSWITNLLGIPWPSLSNIRVPGWEMDYLFNSLVVFGMNFISLFFIWLFPKSKAHARHLKETLGDASTMRWITIVVFFVVMILSNMYAFIDMISPCHLWLGGTC